MHNLKNNYIYESQKYLNFKTQSVLFSVLVPVICLCNIPVFLVLLIIMNNCQNSTFLTGAKTHYTIHINYIDINQDSSILLFVF